MNETPWPFPMTKPIPTPSITVKKRLRALKECVDTEVDERTELLNRMYLDGVGIVHIFDQYNPKGGLTVAFRKTKPEFSSTNMVEVAVATCSDKDTFSRKIGTPLALKAFFAGKTILLPLSNGWRMEELNGSVKNAFSALYFSR